MTRRICHAAFDIQTVVNPLSMIPRINNSLKERLAQKAPKTIDIFRWHCFLHFHEKEFCPWLLFTLDFPKTELTAAPQVPQEFQSV